jgi:hypothetical protein
LIAQSERLSDHLDRTPECEAIVKEIKELEERLTGRSSQSFLELTPEEIIEKVRKENEEKSRSKAKEAATLKEKMTKADCKKLYLKLSKLCHPEKTKDRHLNGIFTLVVAAYRNLNYSTLQNLLENVESYLQIKTSKRAFKQSIRQMIQNLKSQNKLIVRRKEEFKTSVGGTLLSLYNEGKIDEAKTVYLKLLEQQKFNLYSELALRRAAEKTGMTIKSFTTSTDW